VSYSTDDLQPLLHYNAAQLLNASAGNAAHCHVLFDNALSSSSSAETEKRLLAVMDCFQDELMQRIDYDLSAMILGILMIVACWVMDPTAIGKQVRISQLAGCFILVVGCHFVICCMTKSSLCDLSLVVVGIVSVGAVLTAVALLQTGRSWPPARVASLYYFFRELIYSLTAFNCLRY
jgi:hypothetical protein